MAKTWRKQTGSIRIRRDDDGKEFTIALISTFEENRTQLDVSVVEKPFKDLASPDGRKIYAHDEKRFWFGDEPNRQLTLIET